MSVGRIGRITFATLATLAVVVVPAGCSDETRDRIGDAVDSPGDRGGDQQGDGGQGGGAGDQQGDGGQGGGAGDQQADGGQGGGAGDQQADGGQGDGQSGGGTIPEDGNDLADSDLLLLALLGAGAIVAILIVMHFGSTRQERRTRARAGERARLGTIIGGVRWITDQASMEVMRLNDPRQLTASWQATRVRCMDVEHQIATVVATEPDPTRREDLDRLGRCCAGLRVALEADVALRTDSVAPERPDLVSLSTQTVQQRRSELQYALADLERGAR